MFCPNCGQQENQNVQYCRKCGSDLDSVRNVALDSSKLPNAGPKNEIARAFASRIERLSSAKELDKVTEEVLPRIEKFLESPKERRLRRVREGGIVAFSGLGAWIAFAIVGVLHNSGLFVVAGLGFVALMIGVGMMVNGYWFTDVPEPETPDLDDEESSQSESAVPVNTTNDLLMPASAQSQFSSVTENTTRTLDRDKIKEER